MLMIRSDQMKIFEKAALKHFEDEMVAHGKKFSPRLCEAIGDDQLYVAVQQAIERAGKYGFTCRGPIRLYIESMFLFGSDFDTDPQYPLIGEVLNSTDDEMLRADKIFEYILDYQENVSVPKADNMHKAFEFLPIFDEKKGTYPEDDFIMEMYRILTHTFPRKAAYIGDKALFALINEGRAYAWRYDLFTAREEALVVELAFALGYGCTQDPLYPWISQTLRDQHIDSPTGRARQLEKEAKTWFDQVH